MIVREETNLQEWDNWLKTFPASPFIAAPWIESFQTSRHKPIYFRFVLEDQTIGLIAGLILEPSYALLRKIDRSIFFFSGPVTPRPEQDIIRGCLLSLITYAKLHGYTSLDVKSWDYPYLYDLDDRTFYKETREEYFIDLQNEWSEIQKKIRTRIKESVKQANRNGLTFHESNSPSIIEELIRLLEETKSIRRSKGYEDYSYFYMPYFDKAIINTLFQNKIARIFYAQKQDQIVYVSLIVHYNDRACALLVGTNTEGYELKAPAFTWFNMIKTLKEEGMNSFNIGGVANDSGASGLNFFKASFGAEKHTCCGGTTSFLQGSIYNLLYQIYYHKISFSAVRH